MTRAEQLARAIQDGSARDEDVKELARLVLLQADRIALLGEMLNDSSPSGWQVFDDWTRRARKTEHWANPKGEWLKNNSPGRDWHTDRDSYVYELGKVDKEASCNG